MINNRQNGRRRGRSGPRPQGAPRPDGGGNRIDNRARGNAAQLHEKYKSLARDAQMQGDRVLTEYYFQFADHYFRILMESRPRQDETQQGQQGRRDQNGGRYDQDAMSEGYEGEEGSPDEAFGGGDRGNDRQRSDYRQQGDPRTQPEQRQQPNGRYEQLPRREDEAPHAEGSAAEPAEAGDEAPRRRRGRPRRDEAVDAAERIEVDRLPPAMSGESAPAEEPAPRRRGRPRRTAEEGSAAAEA